MGAKGMKIGVVGRGRLGSSLGLAAREAGHAVTLLRRPEASANEASALEEAVLGPDLVWERFDLVLLAFETKLASTAELERDPALRHVRRIPARTPVASIVMSPPPELLDAFLPDHEIAHFLTTPAARLPGAVALLPRTSLDTALLKAALPRLHWIEAEGSDYGRLATLMIGSAIAAASLAHLVRMRCEGPQAGDGDYLQHVLDDAKRLLQLSEGDGFRAFSSVATPGGFTEAAHNAIFATKWPLGS